MEIPARRMERLWIIMPGMNTSSSGLSQMEKPVVEISIISLWILFLKNG